MIFNIEKDKKLNRYVIVDENNNVIDNAQGYGYKSFISALKAGNYKFKGGKQKQNNVKKECKELLKLYPDLKNYINEIIINNFKTITNDDIIIIAVKDRYNIDIKTKYIEFLCD
jgi:flavorubredoxin